MEINKEDHEKYLSEDYLGVHEAAEILEVSEEKLMELIRKHEIPTHNIAGAFTRIKRDELEVIKNKWRIERELFPKPREYFAHHPEARQANFFEKIYDFWYFNDFYILCSFLIVALIYFILASQ